MYIPTVHIISSYFFWPLTSHFSRIICPTYLPKNRKVNWFFKQLLHNLHQLTQFGGISPNLQVCKGSFFSESAICLSNLQEKYSKSLSWTWNLNFPPIIVNNLFKFKLRIVIWKTHETFWKKINFRKVWKSGGANILCGGNNLPPWLR